MQKKILKAKDDCENENGAMDDLEIDKNENLTAHDLFNIHQKEASYYKQDYDIRQR